MSAVFDEYSVFLLYSAMALYALAFVAFALDLARRSARVREGFDVGVDGTVSGQRELVSVGSAAVGSAPSVGTDATIGSPPAEANLKDIPANRRRSLPLRLGVAFTVLGFVFELAATVLRGLAAGRVPWANMYEFSMTGTVIIVGVFLVALLREDLRFLGTFITGLVLVLLGISTVNYYVDVVPLPPALQSAWLVIHVFVATLGTAFFALGFTLSGLQLLQGRREASVARAAAQGTDSSVKRGPLSFLASIPDAVRLENLAYRANVVGFVFWTFTLIAGAIWAERAWGRYWGWDTKEVWTFIIWTIYAGYIHARATRGWRGSRSAWLAIIGFAAVLFNYGIVNVFFKGLHAYSGL